MVNIFHAKQKEIYIVKDVSLLNPSMANSKQYQSRVDEIVDNMCVNYPKNFVFSKDEKINKVLSEFKEDGSLMKMSIGKDDNKLTIFIRAISNEPKPEKIIPKKPKISAKLMFPYIFEFIEPEELF